MRNTGTTAEEFLGLLEPGGRDPYLIVRAAGRARWALPTGSPRLFRASMGVYTPGTARAIAAWYGAGIAAVAGLGGVLPGERRTVDVPLARTLGVIVGHREVSLAIATSFDGQGCVVGAIDPSGAPVAFAKLAPSGDEAAASRLQTEAEILSRVSGKLPRVRVPAVLHIGPIGDHVALVVTAVPGRPGLFPSRLGARRVDAAAEIFSIRGPDTTLGAHLGGDPDDAGWRRRTAEVRACLRGVADLPIPSGLVHGDFAAWNLLEHRSGIGVIDWELARFDGLPYWDLWHLVVQAGGLARSAGAPRSIRESLRGQGALADMLDRYADRCGVPSGIAHDVLLVYLVRSAASLIVAADGGASDARRGLAFRARMLDEALEVLA